DGRLDLVLSRISSRSVSVLLGVGNGTFRSKLDFGTGDSPGAIAIADMNSDGALDVVTADSAAAAVAVLPGTGAPLAAPDTLGAASLQQASTSPIWLRLASG